MQTTLYEDDLQHLYYDHEDEAFYMEDQTPSGGLDEMTQDEAESFLKMHQMVSGYESLLDQLDN